MELKLLYALSNCAKVSPDDGRFGSRTCWELNNKLRSILSYIWMVYEMML